jgi:leader peptidase (prepilin peptidase) / N-methyltransferase
VTLLVALLAVAGAAWGLAADRLAVRWPAHDAEHPAGRPVGWRTLVVIAAGVAFIGGTGWRYADDPLALAAFGAAFLAMVVLLAVDLDQRLLPDLLTLPLAAAALVYALSGQNPLVGGDVVQAVAVAVVPPLILFVVSLPFGAGAFGGGDVKLLVGVGLLAGFPRALTGLLAGLVLAGIVLVALLATGRISRRTYVPFGPFLLAGAAWGILLAP